MLNEAFNCFKHGVRNTRTSATNTIEKATWHTASLKVKAAASLAMMLELEGYCFTTMAASVTLSNSAVNDVSCYSYSPGLAESRFPLLFLGIFHEWLFSTSSEEASRASSQRLRAGKSTAQPPPRGLDSRCEGVSRRGQPYNLGGPSSHNCQVKLRRFALCLHSS